MSTLQWDSPDIGMDNIDVEFLFVSAIKYTPLHFLWKWGLINSTYNQYINFQYICIFDIYC